MADACKEGIVRGRLFIGALKLLALPQLRTDSSIADMETLGFAYEGSFSASKNKCSPSPAFLKLIVFFCSNYSNIS